MKIDESWGGFVCSGRLLEFVELSSEFWRCSSTLFNMIFCK